MRTIKKIKRYVQNHAILFTVLGMICLVPLSPFLVLLTVVTIPLFLVFCSFMAFLILSYSFVFGFLFNFTVVVFVRVTSSYRLIRLAIGCIQARLNYITACPSSIYQYSMRRLHELFSQLRNSFTGDFAEQRMNMEECVDSNNSSELEDIEPDYRDGRDKLYEVLLTKPQYTARDTFEPFQY